MGETHVRNDKVVDRLKVREIDKTMGEHSRAWCSIWGTGANHGQEDRIISSKVTKSENTAKLYLAHKDHKKEENKTRPIGTANSSNTRGFANSVSDLLESVANCEENKFEVISSEDMLHHVKESNVKVKRMKQEWEEKRREKSQCEGCKVWELKCRTCRTKHPTEGNKNHEEITYKALETEKCEGEEQAGDKTDTTEDIETLENPKEPGESDPTTKPGNENNTTSPERETEHREDDKVDEKEKQKNWNCDKEIREYWKKMVKEGDDRRNVVEELI